MPGTDLGWGIAPIRPTGHDVLMAAALVVVFLFILIYRFALRGKGVVSGKLASILAVLFGLWVLLAVSNLALGDSIVAFLAGGVATLFHGIGAFLSMVIP
jgi:membrane protein CcdC involved in cytochrome C biogenesis